MALHFRRGRDGHIRPWWYGEFIRPNGKRAVENLNVPIEGTPPKSGRVKDFGDDVFEKSRTRALVALEALQMDAQKGRMTRAAALKQYHERTGEPLQAAPISALLSARDGEGRRRSADSMRGDNAKLRAFVAWAQKRGMTTVLDVSVAEARAYLSEVYNPTAPRFTARTVRRIKGVLAIALGRTLPEGATNPFRHETLRVVALEGDQEYHREPLTPEEVEKLLNTASAVDPEAHDWIVCALSTGLRRGDVCRLRWANVDAKAQALRLQTGKTKTDLHLPIMPKFAEVLARRMKSLDQNSEYVFPEAATLISGKNGMVISKRVKKVLAMALAPCVERQDEAEALPMLSGP